MLALRWCSAGVSVRAETLWAAKPCQGNNLARKTLMLIGLVSINVLPVVFEKRMVQKPETMLT
jgi:hypothetical protein